MRPRKLRPPLPLLASRTAVAVFVVIVALLSDIGPALAHADFLSSNPEDGIVLDEPPELIEVVFSAPVEPTGPGIRIIDENRQNLAITVFQPSDEVLAAVFDEPPPDGRLVVFYSARSDDGHDVEGSFAFEVVGDVPATTSTTESTPSSTWDPPTTTTVVPVGDSTEDGTASTGWDLLAGAGRWLAIAGAVLAVGAFAFASTSLVGTDKEVRGSVRWIRRGGALVIIGTLVEVAAVSSMEAAFPGSLGPDSIFTTVSTTRLVAAVLRVVGGVALLQSPAMAAVTAVPDSEPTRFRLDGMQEWLTAAGLITILVSFAFDGHTSTLGAFGRVASVVHVAAAGVWAGGTWVMLSIVGRRIREGRSTDTAPMAVRFSRVAAWALGAVFVAGVALAISIADDPADLVSGSWGRVLILKTVLVLTAAAIGAYNHFRVVPRLATGASSDTDLQRTLTAEAVLFIGVTVLTAVLVAAAV